MKFRWKLPPAPTGRFRSFHKRGWPEAVTPGDDAIIGRIECEESYSATQAKTGNHPPLRLYVRQASRTEEERAKHGGFRWLRFIKQFATLDEAKKAFQTYVDAHPDHKFF